MTSAAPVPRAGSLGYHRLAIIDLSENGHQPFAGRRRPALAGLQRRDLQLPRAARRAGVARARVRDRDRHRGGGRSPTTSGATAASPASTACGRSRCTTSTRGGSLLSRDRFGVKPLYYHHGPHRVPVRVRAQVPGRPDRSRSRRDGGRRVPGRVAHRSQAGDPAPRGAPAPAGAPGGVRLRDARSAPGGLLDARPRTAGGTRLELPRRVEEFTGLFDSGVDLRMRSDVPVGSLLSGGLDSSAIVTNLHRRAALPRRRLPFLLGGLPRSRLQRAAYVRSRGEAGGRPAASLRAGGAGRPGRGTG